MRTLKPLNAITVPEPPSDEVYSTDCFGRKISFRGLKALLGAADISKAGDRNAGLTAPDERSREAARQILSQLTLQHLYDYPLTDDQGKVDTVMRVNYDIDQDVFRSIADWTLGEIKDFLLRSPGSAIMPLRRGLTGVMAAAIAKLCDVHELILVARKITPTSKARTLLGTPGTLSARLQPNHPIDDLRGITLLVYWGLSLGSGDALIGLNPSIDTVENVARCLRHLDRVRRQTGAPTQICVLAHLKTQLVCLEQGAPVEVMFQSLAGTESTLLKEFDVSVDLLDHAYRMMAEKGPLKEIAQQCMYFETGQGSEFTYGKHNGMDMTTTEALCYGLARRYDPYMVNNVTGFIGPETHLDNQEMVLSNLQDQFMGKLLGLPMGMAPCYTLHSNITLEGQQMATQLLTAAGALYYMDVALNTDRMLAYFDTSAHDNQSLREVCNLQPAPEFLAWALQKDIYARDENGALVRGKQWGNPACFCASHTEFQELVDATPAVYGFDNAGPRPDNRTSRSTRMNQAVARDAIREELRIDDLQNLVGFRVVTTRATSKDAHLNSPDLGSYLSDESAECCAAEHNQVQILVSDGLSAEAIHHNVPELVPILLEGLDRRGVRRGVPLLARYGRVKLAENVADRLQAELVVYLIGERPGGDALAACSMSTYFVYRLHDAETRRQAVAFSGNPQIAYEYTVISNIYSGGLPAAEAAAVIVEKIAEILQHRAAGNRLEYLLASRTCADS